MKTKEDQSSVTKNKNIQQNQQQMENDYYRKPAEIAEALKVCDIETMVRALGKLRTQLSNAIRGRVDPMVKSTRPLVEYVQGCSDCGDLTRLWDYQSTTHIQNLECIVPDIISMFIRLCMTPIIRAFGLQLIQTILEKQMKYIYRGICSMRIPQCQSTFKLLTSICSFNQSTARDLFHSFNFQTEGFLRASRYRQNKKTNSTHNYIYDLRTNYVELVLAFLRNGDAEVKKQLLNIKGFVSGVFSGMENDAYQLIKETLSVLYEDLLMDFRISRLIKTHFFSSYMLEQVAKLYARNEPEQISPTDTGIPADLAHKFLIDTCTVPGVGVCYRDAGWYPASTLAEGNTEDGVKGVKIQNRVLSKFILSLKPADDIRQQELLLKILAACPELIESYWKTTSMTLEPRISSKWLANVSVLQKTIQIPPPSFYYGDTQLYRATPPDIETILGNTIPNVFGRSFSTKGLLHASPLVRYTTMVVLATVFQKHAKVTKAINQVILALEDSEESSKLLDNTGKDLPSRQWQKCLEGIREGLRRRVPELYVFVGIHSQTSGKKKEKAPEGVDEQEFDTQNEMLGDSAFRLIRYYQEFLPETIMESNTDPSNFVPSDILSVRPSSLVHLLELLLCSPDFKWTNKAAADSFSHITTLLTLYLRTPYKHIRNLTGKLVHKTLADSFMFKHDPEEVEIWLDALPHNFVRSGNEDVALSEEQSIVLKFLDGGIIRFGKAQYKYSDQLAALVESTNKSTLENSPFQNSSDGSLLRYVVGANDPSSMTDDDTTGFSEYTHPFSPLLLALFEYFSLITIEKIPTVRFLTKLMTLLLSKQKVPFYLQNLCEKLVENHEAKTISEIRATPKWDVSEMVRQTQQCLNQKTQETYTSEATVDTKLESQLVTLIKDADAPDMERKMIDMLEILPVNILSKHLVDVATVCSQTLGWSSYEPLVDYLSQRHPLAGSLFDNNEVKKLASLDSPEHEVLIGLLKSVPFTTLFYNAWVQRKPSRIALPLMQNRMDTMSSTKLSHAIHLALEHLTMLLMSDTKEIKSPLLIIFGVLRHALSVLDKNHDLKTRQTLKTLIFDHPALKDLFTRIISLINQLQNEASFPTVFDTSLLDVAVAYVDILGDGLNARELMNSLVRVDYDALFTHCKKANVLFFETTIRLLIALVGDVRRRFDSDNFVIPKETFTVITKLWEKRPSPALEADILSLLELSMTNSQDREALSVLLDVCCAPIIGHILSGKDTKTDMSVLRESCKRSSVAVFAIILNNLRDSLPLTPSLVELIQMGYDLFPETAEERTDYVQQVLEHILKQLTAAADANKMSDTEPIEGFYDKLTSLSENSLEEFNWKLLDTEVVRDFILTTLLDNIADASAIRFTTILVKHVYKNYDKNEPIETYVRRVLDHEKYQTLTTPTIQKPDSQDPENEGQRKAIIALVHALNEIQPNVLSNHHGLLDPLLTSYSATTSVTDRLILQILMCCERNGRNTILPKLLMWGPGSDKTRQAHAQAGTLLQANTISLETLGLIDPGLMKYTFSHFPMDATLSTPKIPDGNEQTQVTYDPDFFLPLFANLIASGAADCRKFIECNALGFVSVSMSSLDENVRRIAFQMMDQFYVILDHAKFREQSEIMFLLDVFKNSIVGRSSNDVPPRIPAAVTVCVAHALSIILHPGHYMLPSLAKWMTQSAAFDFNYVPLFGLIFSSSSENHKKERLWMLRVLSSSMRTYEDYKMFSRQRIWDMIAVFYSSALADQSSKKAIVEIMEQATSIPSVSGSLIKYNGLLAWIHQILALSPDAEEAQQWEKILSSAIETASRHEGLPDHVKEIFTDELEVLNDLY
ncbi:ribosome 60S biogenesis N-terminal-domain-containing protein [Phycomyces nitens]|nr:ribosome 60S biogenesis N-terminal-domain-containing protein [Phycomyces nitens]